MMRDLSGAVARRRRAVLVAAAALAASALVARALGVPADTLAPWLLLPGLTAVVLHLTIMMRRPARLLAGDGAFRTPPTAGPTLAAVGHLALLSVLLLYPGTTTPAGIPHQVGAVLLAVAFLGYPRALWYGIRVTLTADGLRADKYAGTITVPWDALDAAEPVSDPDRIRLRYARPDLVEVTGWTISRRTVEVEGVKASFVAAAIRFYAAHPDRRASIGTADGLDRLFESVVPRT